MILVFILSMPSSGAWDGKWSGDGKLYAKIVNLGRSKKAEAEATKILATRYYRYNFGDGWVAGIEVKEVDGKEATKIRRASHGFCGYDWMVNSIRNHGRIQVPGGDDNADHARENGRVPNATE